MSSLVVRASRLRPNAALRWGLGLGVLALLIVFIDPRGLADGLGAVDWTLAGPAVAGLVLVHIINAIGWKLIMRRLGDLEIGWGVAWRLHYAAQAVGGLSPGNIGADAYKALALRSWMGWSETVPALLVQRLTSYVVLIGMGVAAIAVLPVVRPELSPVTVAAVVVAAGLVVAGAFVLGPRLMSAARIAFTAQVLPATWVGLISGAAFHAVSIGLAYVIVLSTGVKPDPIQTLAALAIARLAIALPLTPAGLGLQEGALSVIFPEIGIPAQVAITSGVVGRLPMLISMLLGGYYVIRKPLGLAMAEAAASSPPLSRISRTKAASVR